MKRFVLILAAAIIAAACGTRPRVVVYGGTSAGVIAAYSAACSGCDVTLVCPEGRFGGMTTGGLGYTDIGNKQVVTGLARKFYRLTGEHYGRLESWVFEPHVAEDILKQFVLHPRIRPVMGMWIESADTLGGKILSIKLTDGKESLHVAASQFIDCSYEGDLMAAAGVSYVVGREDNSLYDETWNGCQMLQGHQFPDGIDPFVREGDPSSGLLPGVSYGEVIPGRGDSLVQAYNFRICLTDSVENMVPIARPADYDSTRYELLRRLMRACPGKQGLNDYLIWSRMPGRKTDINNRGGFSTDLIGGSHLYPEAPHGVRREIVRQHRSYTEGLLYFLGHDEAVPAPLRAEILRWGWPKDEFGGALTPQLYIRETRRMVGEYVCTQADCEGRREPEDAAAMAAYTMDSHNCRRVAVRKDGRWMVKNEGNVEIPGGGPYPIPYRAVTPRRAECTNLLVPVCLSASHIAYGSIRMEPVFMVLGQVCGMAAADAARRGVAVQDVSAAAIRESMEKDPYMDGSAPDIIIDDNTPLVDLPEGWMVENNSIGYGRTFIRSNPGDTSGSVVYHMPPGVRGRYAVYAYQHKVWNNPGIFYHIGDATVPVNLDSVAVSGQTAGEWLPLGVHRLSPSTRIRVTYAPTPDLPCKSDAIMLVKD